MSKKSRLWRTKKSAGLSMIEAMITIGLGGVVMFGAFKTLKSTTSHTDWLLSYSDSSSVIDSMRANIRAAYVYRTQIDPITGEGIYNGVEYDRDTNPNEFSIYLRSAADTDAISRVSYRTACAKIKPGSMPPDWTGGCADMPSCTGDKTLTIIERFYENAEDTTPTKTRMIPPRRGKVDQFFRGAAMCIREADNDRISILMSVANKDQADDGAGDIVWKNENIEIWDDLGRQGVEFLR